MNKECMVKVIFGDAEFEGTFSALDITSDLMRTQKKADEVGVMVEQVIEANLSIQFRSAKQNRVDKIMYLAILLDFLINGETMYFIVIGASSDKVYLKGTYDYDEYVQHQSNIRSKINSENTTPIIFAKN